MSIDAALNLYFTNGHEEVEGWFYPLDMLLFSHLDQTQKASRVEGDICELGVYKGKSLIYLNLLSRAPENVFAFDLFPDDLLETTKRNMDQHTSIHGLGEVQYVSADSTEHTVSSLKQYFQRPLRMLHIDAGHEYHEVLHSLYTFVPFVSNQGIVIMDDYQDHDFPGIESAVYEFTRRYDPRRFVPFLAGANKMYLCNPAMSMHYQFNLISNQHLADKCRLTRVEDYFVLVTGTKLPMKNSQIEKILTTHAIPYEYDINEVFLQKRARQFGQYSAIFKDEG